MTRCVPYAKPGPRYGHGVNLSTVTTAILPWLQSKLADMREYSNLGLSLLIFSLPNAAPNTVAGRWACPSGHCRIGDWLCVEASMMPFHHRTLGTTDRRHAQSIE